MTTLQLRTTRSFAVSALAGDTPLSAATVRINNATAVVALSIDGAGFSVDG